MKADNIQTINHSIQNNDDIKTPDSKKAERAVRREKAAAKIKEKLAADKQNYARTIKQRNLVRALHVALSLIALTLSIGLVVSTLPILIAILWVTIMLQPVAPAVMALCFFDHDLTNEAKNYKEDYIGPYIDKLMLVAALARHAKADDETLKKLLTDSNAFAKIGMPDSYENIKYITFSEEDAPKLVKHLMQILNDYADALKKEGKIEEFTKSRKISYVRLGDMIKDSQAIKVVIKDMLRRGAEKDSVQQLN